MIFCRKLIFFLFLAFILFYSCKKENDFDKLATIEWNPSISAPLISSSMSIEDILIRTGENEHIEIDSNNLITLIYSSHQNSLKGNEIFQIPDISKIISDSINFLVYDFDNGELVKTLILEEGTFSYELSSSIPEDVNVSINFPYITKSGIPLSTNFNLSFDGDIPISSSETFNLQGYEIDMTAGGITTNTIAVEYMVKNLSGTDVTEFYPIGLVFNDLLFEYVSGYLGQHLFNIKTDSIELKIFKNWVDGIIYLDNPEIKVLVENSFGMPITGEFITLTGLGNTNTPITGSAVDSFALEFPDIVNAGEFVNTIVLLDDTNSNISSFLAMTPKVLFYSLFFKANAENDTNQVNFITNESEFRIDVDVRFPMQGRISNVIIRDTFELDVSTEDLFQNINSAVFKLQVENKLPLDAFIQLYFVDSTYQILDSLFTNQDEIFLSGEIDNAGIVINPRSKTSFVFFDTNSFENIRKTSYIIIKSRLSSFNNGSETVRFYSDYFLDIKLGVNTSLIID